MNNYNHVAVRFVHIKAVEEGDQFDKSARGCSVPLLQI